jgi:hypothetical protein
MLASGGDENNGKQWAANAIQSFMEAQNQDAHALQTYSTSASWKS